MLDSKTGTLVASFDVYGGELNGADFSGDGKRLALACDDGTVRLWDLAESRELLSFRVGSRLAYHARFAADERSIISCGDAPVIQVWDAAAGEHQADLTGHNRNVEAIAVSPDGQRFASAGGDGTTRLWDLKERRELLAMKTHYPPVVMASAVFSPDGRWLATADWNRQVLLWDLATLAGHGREVMWVTFSPDGRSLITSSSDGTLRVWHASSGEELFELHDLPGGFRGIDLSPDGRWLAACTFHTERILLLDLTGPAPR